MPFTKNPSISTYDTKRENFVISPLQRSASSPNKDAIISNMLVEMVDSADKQNNKIFVKSRPGLSSVYSHTAGVGRGIYYWKVSGVGYIIYVIGNSVYSNGALLQTIGTSTGEVGFTEHVSSTGTNTLIMVDGTAGYFFTSPTVAATQMTAAVYSAWTASTSLPANGVYRPVVSNGFTYRVTVAGTTGATEPTWPTTAGATVANGSVTFTCEVYGFPTPHIPQPIVMDGYLFLAKAGTHDIYNSDLDSPTKWTPGDFISAEMYPDTIVSLSKNNNYIYAVGSSSVEYLYDAANATGSPLSKHDSAVQQFGAAASGAVVQTDKEVVLIGATDNGGHTVWAIEGFKSTEIGTPAVRSMLRAEGSSLSSAIGHCIRASGQKLYLIHLSTKSLCYSFDTKMWCLWTSGVTSNDNFLGTHSADGSNGMAYILGEASGKVYQISESYFTDDGAAFLCQIVTPKYDYDTMNRKFCARLSLVGDIPDSTGAGNIVQVSWSDDDYQSWVTNRDLSFDFDFPMIAQLGNFRRRAYRFQYSQPYLLRLEGFEVDINKGNQ